MVFNTLKSEGNRPVLDICENCTNWKYYFCIIFRLEKWEILVYTIDRNENGLTATEKVVNEGRIKWSIIMKLYITPHTKMI